MSKSTKSVRTVAEVQAAIEQIRADRKAAKQKFQADLDQRFVDYRAEVKALREQKAKLFAELAEVRKTEKAATKTAKTEKVTEVVKVAKKPAKKAPTKKAAKKTETACVVIDDTEA